MNNLDFKLSRRRKDSDSGEWYDAKTLCHFKGNSSTQSNPTSTTTTDVTDNRVAASEGSVSAGSGANVSISSTDPQAFDAISQIAASANDTTEKTATSAIAGNVSVSKEAITGNTDVARDALDFAGKATGLVVQGQRDALDFGSDLAHQAIAGAIASQESANDLVRDTNENFVAKLAANAGEAPTTLADNTVKYIAIAIGAIGLVYVFKSSK